MSTCRLVRTGNMVLILTLAALGASSCGGGRVAPNAQINQGAQASTAVSRSMEAPALGFAYTAGGTEVRLMSGVPGASIQGAPLTLPSGVSSVNFAPLQKSAIVELSGGGPVGVVSFPSTDPGPIVSISGAISHPDIIAFSPTGAAAALYSASAGHLQVVTGLPDSPQLIRDLASDDLPGTPKLLAIADDGVTLLEGTTDNAVYLLSTNNGQLIANAASLGAVAFNPKSNDVLIFDGTAGTLTLVRNVSTLRSSQLLASGMTGLEGAISLVSTGRTALVAGQNARNIWEVDLQSPQAVAVPLPAPSTMLVALRLAGDYLLSWQPGGLAWILDTNQSKAAVDLVPLAAPAQAEVVSGGRASN